MGWCKSSEKLCVTIGQPHPGPESNLSLGEKRVCLVCVCVCVGGKEREEPQILWEDAGERNCTPVCRQFQVYLETHSSCLQLTPEVLDQSGHSWGPFQPQFPETEINIQERVLESLTSCWWPSQGKESELVADSEGTSGDREDQTLVLGSEPLSAGPVQYQPHSGI